MITRKDLGANPLAASDEAANAKLRAMDEAAAQKAAQDAKLAELIKGKQLEQEHKNQMLTRQIGEAERLRGLYGPEASVNVEGVSVGARDPLQSLLRARELSRPVLTPAQETSEKESGKKLSAYEVSGGSPGMQKHMTNQESVLNELKSGKRDLYDKIAGKVAGGIPSLLGVIAPSEKARMDKIQAAAIQNIRATDPNPAQVLIDQTLSRAYDPRLSDAENIAKIQADYETAKATKQQMEQASSNLQRTGYAMPGLGGSASVRTAPQAPASPAAPPQRAVTLKDAPLGLTPEQFRAWKAQNGL